MRFKFGKNINTENKEVFISQNGEDMMLPKENIFTKYIFACNNQYLLYPNNYNFHQNSKIHSNMGYIFGGDDCAIY